MTLANKVNQFTADADLVNKIVNGDENTTVQTAGGPVRTISKVIKDTLTWMNNSFADLLQRKDAEINQRYFAIKVRGAWSAATDYAVHDVAIKDGIAYLCMIAHKSTGDFTADVNAKYWMVYQGVVKRGSYSKRITVIGSSVPYGYGATNFNGYMRRFAAAIAGYGYSVANVCVPGDTTALVINRFYRDVLPTDPDILIIALGLGNQGIKEAVDKEALYQSYIEGIFTLVNMGRQLGYKVLVTGCYPRNDFTAVEYQYVRQANQELENSGIPYINLLGAVDDGTGKWRAGMWADDGHPNDIGHEAMFRTIPLSLFDRLPYGDTLMADAQDGVYSLNMGNDNTSYSPLMYQPESDFGSVTAMVNVRRPGATLGQTVVAFNNTKGLPLRVRNPKGPWGVGFDENPDLPSGNWIEAGAETPPGTMVNVCLRSDYYTNTHTLFLDGVKVGTFTRDVGTITSISFGGRSDTPAPNATNHDLDGFAVWRAALTDEQVYEAAKGRISKGSLCLYSPMVDAFVQPGSRLVNLAPSKTYLRVNTTTATAKKKIVNGERLTSIETRLTALDTPQATFVPTFPRPGFTYLAGAQLGWYTRIGDRVFFDIELSWTAAAANTPMEITLPWICKAKAILSNLRITSNTAAAGSDVYGFINLDESQITLAALPRGGAAWNPILANTGGGSVRISGCIAVK